MISEYRRIDTYYDTCTMGRAEVLEARLHLGTGPGTGTMVVLKVPPDRQQLRSGHVLESGRFFAYSLLVANHLNREIWLAR